MSYFPLIKEEMVKCLVVLIGDQLSGAAFLNWFYSGLDEQICLECCDRTRVKFNQQQTLLMGRYLHLN